MNAYVDASVLVRLVFGEPDQLESWGRITRPISSELIKVECLRAMDRARLLVGLPDETVADRRATALELIASFDLVPITASIVERAAEPFPTALGTLDAIHLASALAIRRTEFGPFPLATHDRELALAARSVGFDVEGV